ncbi:MAG: polyribonucleotide nucleotidyltransferase [Candidatus Latescibacteria bacterium]|nr:polyribonucleotide nucleotidyltransferase [Candidatus Latescibacterota bacterium]
MYKKVNKQIGMQTLSLETGRVAKQADGSILVTYGDSTVLATVCVEKKSNPDRDFLPLTVEYREKSYAIGKIPGNFFRREGRPNTKEILSARQIDRPLRPLFPKGFSNEIQIIVNVLSSDQQHDQDVLGVIGASAACTISPVPLQKVVGAVHVGHVNGEYVINPTYQQLEESDINIVVAGSDYDILMVEGSCSEVAEEVITGAIEFSKEYIKAICDLQRELCADIAAPDMEFEAVITSDEMVDDIIKDFASDITNAIRIKNKIERKNALNAVFDNVLITYEEKYPENGLRLKLAFEQILKETMRSILLEENTRLDGRTPTEIRPITCEVGVLPRAHGSALFTRGQTQSLGVATLGTKLDERMIDDLEGTSYKSYMLDYNFLPFSTGEVKMMRGTSRRETGHGNLAESAITPVIPHEDIFPYTIRIVSDILESNGSSSMATICSGSLCLMDAGVPIKTAVAGIAMGLIKEGDKYVILSDILGDEDHLGDMDFKVAGTKDGITAIQMDIKIDGINMEILTNALAQANEGRHHILRIMNETLAEPRESLSEYAPSIITMKIDVDKIGAVIGPGGKIIKGIQEQTGATINIDDDGTVVIAAVEMAAGQAAYDMVFAIVEDPEIGKVYKGTVKRIVNFGAFVEILPGKEGLVHISEMDNKRINKVEDVVKLGDVIDVKVIGIDDQGKIKCSRKAALNN